MARRNRLFSKESGALKDRPFRFGHVGLPAGPEEGSSRARGANPPLRVLVAGLVVLIAIAAAIYLSPLRYGHLAGVLLLALGLLGIAVAVAASREEDPNRYQAWSELGVGLLVAGLLAFAVWLVAEMRRPIEEREALQAMLGFERDMPGIDLHEKDMERFDLSGRNLEGANLAGTQLDHATLVEANLSGADLSGADLSGANLEAADLSNADLTGADLGDTAASRADLHEARLFEADLSGAELSRANLRGACLAAGSLAEASLPGAHLERAALTGADLEGAKFWLDLRRAFLATIGLDGAKHTEAAEWPPGFDDRAEDLTTPDDLPPPRLARAPGETGGGRVKDVPDGDSVLLENWAGRRKMRPIGIDAPELEEVGGRAAREALRALLPQGTWARFTHDERRMDKSGRELVYLFGTDGRLVNQQMLRKGVAVSSIDPPDRREGLRNVRYARRLASAEAWARQQSRGLWRTCPPP